MGARLHRLSIAIALVVFLGFAIAAAYSYNQYRWFNNLLSADAIVETASRFANGTGQSIEQIGQIRDGYAFQAIKDTVLGITLPLGIMFIFYLGRWVVTGRVRPTE